MDDLEDNVVGRIALDGRDLRQLWHGSAWPCEQEERQQRRILSWWWVKNVEDIELMDEVAEDVNKVALSARTNSEEKEGEEVFPEQREVHFLGGGRCQVQPRLS